MYQSSNIHKMLTKNTEIRYINNDEEKKYFDSTFIDESCRLIIKQLSKKSQNLEVLNLKKMDKGTNKLVRVIRRNLSSFEVIVPALLVSMSLITQNELYTNKDGISFM